MLDTFLFAVNAIAPILLLILLGYGLHHTGLLTEEFLTVGNRVTFQVLLPVLLFTHVYSIESLGAIRWGVVLLAVGMIFLLFFLGLLTARLFVPDRKQKGVIAQSTYRCDLGIIGVSLAQSIGGATGAVSIALISAFAVPLFNILGVVDLSLYSGAKRPGLRQILREICHNHLIIGIALGFVCLIIRALLPETADGVPVFTMERNLPFLYTGIQSVAKMASPLALLILGGRFRFDAVSGMRKQIVLGTAWRVALAPALGLGLAFTLNAVGVLKLTGGDFAALVALFGSPCAVAGVIMAEEMGNDGQLAGQLMVWTSICSVFMLLLQIILLRGLGMV